jgi:hypothetical protein
MGGFRAEPGSANAATSGWFDLRRISRLPECARWHRDEPAILRTQRTAGKIGRQSMNCEEVRLAAMALADGEQPALPRAVIEGHTAECTACRKEIQALGELNPHWEAQARKVYTASLWRSVEKRITDQRRYRWVPLFVGLLLIFRATEFIPEQRLNLCVQLVPLFVAAAVFMLMKQNPFQIKTDFRSHEELL